MAAERLTAAIKQPDKNRSSGKWNKKYHYDPHNCYKRCLRAINHIREKLDRTFLNQRQSNQCLDHGQASRLRK